MLGQIGQTVWVLLLLSKRTITRLALLTNKRSSVCLRRVRPRHQCGELRGILLARVLLQLQEVQPLTGQQALRHQWRSHLLPRLRQEAVNCTISCAGDHCLKGNYTKTDFSTVNLQKNAFFLIEFYFWELIFNRL